MTEQDITACMQTYVEHREMSGGALMVRKDGELIYQNKWGMANLGTKEEVSYDSIYRMMSMSKCVTAVAIMQLIESGKMDLDDPLSKYVPEFKNMQVASDKRYVIDMKNPKKILLQVPLFKMEKVKTVPADREITIRDLLSHSSGLEQGAVGLIAMMKMKNEDQILEDRVMRYSRYVLDFQPGSATNYSPLAGFDILGYIVERVSGLRLEEYIQRNICEPLDMKDTTFFLNDEQKKRLVHVYKRENEKLKDVTGTKDDMFGMLHQEPLQFEEGSGGLFSTIIDYEHFGEMLYNQGTYHGRQILKPETVSLMHTEAAEKHLESEPGMVWGLGMKIRQNPEAAKSFATEGTYGWSGAFGTHFFVSPKDQIEVVFVTNRCDLGGSGSYISTKVEELVFDVWGGK